MNSSPTGYSIVSPTKPAVSAKPTVPEMCTLYHLIAQSALNSAKLRAELQKCSSEERSFLYSFFVKASSNV